MTHDELLVKIDGFIFDEGDGVHIAFVDAFDALQALRAVVELHPRKALGFSGRWSCGECLVEYPCKTIQAIEKELK